MRTEPRLARKSAQAGEGKKSRITEVQQLADGGRWRSIQEQIVGGRRRRTPWNDWLAVGQQVDEQHLNHQRDENGRPPTGSRPCRQIGDGSVHGPGCPPAGPVGGRTEHSTTLIPASRANLPKRAIISAVTALSW